LPTVAQKEEIVQWRFLAEQLRPQEVLWDIRHFMAVVSVDIPAAVAEAMVELAEVWVIPVMLQ